MSHKDDIRFVLIAPDGSWLSASIGGRSVVGEELRDVQKTIEGRGGPNKDLKFAVAQNDNGLPPPSAEEEGRPWVPTTAKRRRRRKRKAN